MTEPLPTDISQQWRSFTQLVRRRLWTILTFLTITVLVVATGTWMQTPIYQASATVLIEMESPNVLAVSTSREDLTLGRENPLTYGDYYRTQLEVIRSRTVAHRVLHTFKLQEQAPYASARDPISYLLNQVTVEPVKQTRLAKISVEDPDPGQAARIANAFAVTFTEENLAISTAAEAMTLMKNEYLALQSKEAELSKRYKAKHPAMARLRQEMEQLAQAIEEETRRQFQYGRFQTEDTRLAPEEGQTAWLERLKDRAMMGSLRPNNVRVQDLARPPSQPAKPNKQLNLLLALFLGLVGGFGVAAAQELLDSSLKVPEDIEQDHRFVLLGYVPQIDGLPAHSTDKAHQRERWLHLEHPSRAAEAYRALRTSLLYAIPEGHSRAILVTSPGTEEGKTTTVSNLSIAIAQTGLRVLLVDGDLRKGRLHDVFGLSRIPGLSEFLVGQASFEAIAQPSGIQGLSVVTSGAFPPNPSELLGSSKMQEFLQHATTAFDRVLFDSAPMIAVTDAVIVAALTKTVVAVAQSGRTPRQALRRLTALCQEVGAKVLGVVLNNVPTHEAPAYYRYSVDRYAST